VSGTRWQVPGQGRAIHDLQGCQNTESALEFQCPFRGRQDPARRGPTGVGQGRLDSVHPPDPVSGSGLEAGFS
jgi:hypothetical protein